MGAGGLSREETFQPRQTRGLRETEIKRSRAQSSRRCPERAALAFGEPGGLAEAEFQKFFNSPIPPKARDYCLEARFRDGKRCALPSVFSSPSPFPQQSKL